MSEFDPTVFEANTGFSADTAYQAGRELLVILGKRNHTLSDLPQFMISSEANYNLATRNVAQIGNPDLTAQSREVAIRNLGLTVLTEQL